MAISKPRRTVTPVIIVVVLLAVAGGIAVFALSGPSKAEIDAAFELEWGRYSAGMKQNLIDSNMRTVGAEHMSAEDRQRHGRALSEQAGNDPMADKKQKALALFSDRADEYFKLKESATAADAADQLHALFLHIIEPATGKR